MNPVSRPRPAAWKLALLTIVGLPLMFVTLIPLAERARDWYEDSLPENRTRFAMAELGYLICTYKDAASHPAMPPSADNRKLVALFSKKTPSPPSKEGFGDISPYLNAKGEIVDGWGTPLRIEFSGVDDFQIISAGPDKIFKTADDISEQGAGGL